MLMNKRGRFSLSTTQIILLSFIVAIGVGSLLLALPISAADGHAVPYVDALFTATTATCVTGLVTVPTATTWSVFGQIVILILIQIGGLGIITIMSGFMLMLNRKMGIGDRLLLQDAFNLNTMSGLAKFIRNILLGTLIIEGIGALLYMTVFVPSFGARGIWISVFNAVSAFCNAGIDIIGENSLYDYATNPIINIVTSALIIIGGIGYIVWWDVLRVLRGRTPKNRRVFRHLTLHSKIAIVTTLSLIFGGGLFLFIVEYNNPESIGSLSLIDKIQVSLFQSVTTRTAGFASVPQESLTGAGAILSMILMFIGGSPVGTAGGVKTVTVAVLLCSALSTVRNKQSATLFNRAISADSIRKAVAVVATFVCILLSSTVLLSMTTDASSLDVFYEAMSATATVGLSRNVTSGLDSLGKIIIIFTMYFGRVGPISLAVALGSRGKDQNAISDPVEEISIG
ncbi:MAG: potassium transporter KtrB [Ruminococcaceae bacterium]|nr:potassium transporter KtrB [Oscillospiraceae bacterium]